MCVRVFARVVVLHEVGLFPSRAFLNNEKLPEPKYVLVAVVAMSCCLPNTTAMSERSVFLNSNKICRV